jgi:hypothetical protein
MPRGCDRVGPWATGRGSGLRLLAIVLVASWLSACGATTSRTTDDATVTTRVKIALLNDPQVGPMRLDVKTFQGVVTLSGTVKTAADARQAIAVARTTSGVRDVKSELKVEGSRVPGF